MDVAQYRATPLTPLKETPDRTVPVAERGEPLVPVSLYPSKILVRSWYFTENLPHSSPECYLREGAFERLVEASGKLPANWRFVVWDCWRSPKLQTKLFEVMEGKIAKANPSFTPDEIQKAASVFVALPSTDSLTVSGHCTGGAVDLSIADDRGRLLEMGGLFDEPTERSYSRHYEDMSKNISLTGNQQAALENRRLLIHIMEEAGFSNYPSEWWHFDYGNRNWALRTGAPEAFYAFTSPYSPWGDTDES